jgi:hypothetical protein
LPNIVVPISREERQTMTSSLQMRWLAAAVTLLAATAHADDYDGLGSLERIEVDAVLAERDRAVERAPQAKTVREIIVVIAGRSTRPSGSSGSTPCPSQSF